MELTHSTIPTVQGRDVNSAINIRHALVEMLLGHKRPASLQPGGGGGGGKQQRGRVRASW